MDLNDKAPTFTVPDEDGKPVSLKNFAGKPVVLFFFPKADTPGWTIEACGFRDQFTKLQRAGAVVLGISADTPQAQKKFKDKYSLPYTLLSDTDKQVAESYGVIKEKNMYGRKVMGIERTSFLIDEQGKIAKIFPKVKPEGHAEEVLAEVRRFKWGVSKKAFQVRRFKIRFLKRLCWNAFPETVYQKQVRVSEP
jgi:thioredoxin-dependent peroxiredoxin